MPRASMAYLISLLRTKVNDTASEVWSDDDLENYLDIYQTPIRRALLLPDVDKKEYLCKFQLLEGTYARSTDSGASWDDDIRIIKLWQSDGGSATSGGDPDGWDLVSGRFWWTSAQTVAYYLDAYMYNLEGATAECLEQLAMDPQKARVWSRGGVRFSHYDLMEMAKYHRGLAGATSRKVIRTYPTD